MTSAAQPHHIQRIVVAAMMPGTDWSDSAARLARLRSDHLPPLDVHIQVGAGTVPSFLLL